MRKWRKDSEFGEGERVPLDREQKAVARARLHMSAFRGPGRLTANAVAIGKRLLDMLGKDGALFPSIATLAELEGIKSTSTVVLALKRLRQLGFLAWTRRLVRAGNHVRQTSNAYRFCCDGGSQQGALQSSIVPKQKGSGGAAPASLTDREAVAGAARAMRLCGWHAQADQLERDWNIA